LIGAKVEPLSLEKPETVYQCLVTYHPEIDIHEDITIVAMDIKIAALLIDG
jgi:hypothetical protein